MLFRTNRHLPFRPLTNLPYILVVLLSLVARPLYAANPGTGQTSQGQTLNILIDESVRDRVLTPRQAFVLNGTTAIGALVGQANVLYVIDVSGSTASPVGQDCDGNGAVDSADDFNNDGSYGDTLDCEISGVVALNDSLSATAGISGGLIAFGSEAAIADIGAAAGEQTFATPLTADQNGNSIPDLEEVATSATQGRLSLFTQKSAGTGTSFNNAIDALNQAFATTTAGANVAFFLSDGQSSVSTSTSGALAEAVAAGTTINTYSVGSASTGCAEGAALRTIADETGGTCTEVVDPTQLRVVLPGTRPANIDRVETMIGTSGPLLTALDALGNWAIAVPEEQFQAFPLTIAATVYATDGTAVTADITLDPPAPTALERASEPELRELAPIRIYLPLTQ